MLSTDRPHYSQKMMTLLDKGESDVSSDVENIEVANGYESDCKTHLNNPFKW